MLKLKTNKTSGITLIALVVTIIVLLILAGISIMMLTGNNGILQRASDAKEATIAGQEKEQVQLAYNSATMKKLGDNVTGEELQHELDLSVGAGKTEVEGQTILDVLFTDTNHSYTVENGKVEKKGPVVNPYDPDEWEFAWVYPTAEGKWSGRIEKNNPLPSNYKIIAKVYEGKESDVKYSLVIEGEGEIKDLSVNSDPDNFTPPELYAWQTGFFSSEGPLFAQEGNTVNVRICDGITGIGDGAFTLCRGVKSIKISNTVTSIGTGAFVWCQITSIKIPNGVTNIGDQAFYTCGSLTNVNIPNGVARIGKQTFSGCAIKSIKIPNSVTSIEEQAFEGCSFLENVEIPDSVTSIGYCAFGNCVKLKNVEMSNSITSIGNRAFYGCAKLRSVDLSSSITSIGDSTFAECYELQSIEIPNSVTSIGDSTFAECYELQSIEIPNSVTSIGDSAFRVCLSLTEIIIHKPEDSITGAKWGADSSVQVTWTGEN